jgi:xanthine dehydrogenase accessory factor
LPFRFTVVDDRPEFLQDLDLVDTLCVAPSALGDHLRPAPRMAILLVSRNHELDGDYLEAVFAAEEATDQEVTYLGVVGSHTKAKVLAHRFREPPAWRSRFARIEIPVGLSIGAETPAEVALSILAEVLGVFRGVAWITGEDGGKLGVYCQRSRPAAPPDNGQRVMALTHVPDRKFTILIRLRL